MNTEGPGALREGGPRHDNDHVYIEDICIIPTHQELVGALYSLSDIVSHDCLIKLCKSPPYLPANIFGAPHLFAESSMERLLDVQYRLYREELMSVNSQYIESITD
jgi:hypothetical protein